MADSKGKNIREILLRPWKACSLLRKRRSEIYPPDLMLRPSLMQEKWFGPAKAGHIEVQVGCFYTYPEYSGFKN